MTEEGKEMRLGISYNMTFLLVADPNNINILATNWPQALGQFFSIVFVFVIILLIAVYSLRFAGRLKNTASFGNNLNVIESKALGVNTFVHIVKAGDKYVLVGTAKDNIALLGEMDKDSITERTSTDVKFGDYLKKYTQKNEPKE